MTTNQEGPQEPYDFTLPPPPGACAPCWADGQYSEGTNKGLSGDNSGLCEWDAREAVDNGDLSYDLSAEMY